FILGEIAHSEAQNDTYVPINYQLELSLCAQNNMGYFVWWWGIVDADNNPLAMSDGTVSTLTPIGTIFASGNSNALVTAIRLYKCVHGQCEALSAHDINQNENKIYPLPTNGKLRLEFREKISSIILYDLSGRVLMKI